MDFTAALKRPPLDPHGGAIPPGSGVPIKPENPVEDTQAEIPKVGSRDAPGG